MKSDLLVARLMGVAGAKGALAQREINLEGLKDRPYVAQMRGKVDELRKRSAESRGSSVKHGCFPDGSGGPGQPAPTKALSAR